MTTSEASYGLRSRPIGYGNLPRGYIREDPPLSDDGERYTRYGIAVYSSPLNPKEANDYELVRILITPEEVCNYANLLAMKMAVPYQRAPEWLKEAEAMIAEDEDTLRQSVFNAFDDRTHTVVPTDFYPIMGWMPFCREVWHLMKTKLLSPGAHWFDILQKYPEALKGFPNILEMALAWHKEGEPNEPSDVPQSALREAEKTWENMRGFLSGYQAPPERKPDVAPWYKDKPQALKALQAAWNRYFQKTIEALKVKLMDRLNEIEKSQNSGFSHSTAATVEKWVQESLPEDLKLYALDKISPVGWDDESPDGSMRKAIAQYGKDPAPPPTHKTDPRPATPVEAYFVTAATQVNTSGDVTSMAPIIVLGPYEDHLSAIQDIPRARRAAEKADPQAVWWGFGTARAPRFSKTWLEPRNLTFEKFKLYLQYNPDYDFPGIQNIVLDKDAALDGDDGRQAYAAVLKVQSGSKWKIFRFTYDNEAHDPWEVFNDQGYKGPLSNLLIRPPEHPLTKPSFQRWSSKQKAWVKNKPSDEALTSEHWATSGLEWAWKKWIRDEYQRVYVPDGVAQEAGIRDPLFTGRNPGLTIRLEYKDGRFNPRPQDYPLVNQLKGQAGIQGPITLANYDQFLIALSPHGFTLETTGYDPPDIDAPTSDQDMMSFKTWLESQDNLDCRITLEALNHFGQQISRQISQQISRTSEPSLPEGVDASAGAWGTESVDTPSLLIGMVLWQTEPDSGKLQPIRLTGRGDDFDRKPTWGWEWLGGPLKGTTHIPTYSFSFYRAVPQDRIVAHVRERLEEETDYARRGTLKAGPERLPDYQEDLGKLRDRAQKIANGLPSPLRKAMEAMISEILDPLDKAIEERRMRLLTAVTPPTPAVMPSGPLTGRPLLRALFEIKHMEEPLDHDLTVAQGLITLGLAKHKSGGKPGAHGWTSAEHFTLTEEGKKLLDQKFPHYAEEALWYYAVSAKHVAMKTEKPEFEGDTYRFAIMNRNEMAMHVMDEPRFSGPVWNSTKGDIFSIIGETQQIAGL